MQGACRLTPPVEGIKESLLRTWTHFLIFLYYEEKGPPRPKATHPPEEQRSRRNRCHLGPRRSIHHPSTRRAEDKAVNATPQARQVQLTNLASHRSCARPPLTNLALHGPCARPLLTNLALHGPCARPLLTNLALHGPCARPLRSSMTSDHPMIRLASLNMSHPPTLKHVHQACTDTILSPAHPQASTATRDAGAKPLPQHTFARPMWSIGRTEHPQCTSLIHVPHSRLIS